MKLFTEKCSSDPAAEPYVHVEVPAEPYVDVQIPAEPYVHEEIPAEPYVHEEIPAEPYVHEEPALSAEALGQVAYSAPVATGATGYAAGPVVITGAWSGACLNNLGQAVPCRQ